MQNRAIKISKFLSLVLRHKPEEIAITLDRAGWVLVSELLNACNAAGFSITREELEEVVRTSDKQRFALVRRPLDDQSQSRPFHPPSTRLSSPYAARNFVSRNGYAIFAFDKRARTVERQTPPCSSVRRQSYGYQSRLAPRQACGLTYRIYADAQRWLCLLQVREQRLADRSYPACLYKILKRSLRSFRISFCLTKATLRKSAGGSN